MGDFVRLGKDVIGLILRECTAKSVLNLGATCHALKAFVDRQPLWAHFLRRDYGRKLVTEATPIEAYRVEFYFAGRLAPTGLDPIWIVDDWLVAACKEGDELMVRALIARGARDSSEFANALQCAVKSNHVRNVRLLLQWSLSPDFFHPSAVFGALYAKSFDVLNYLLKVGFDVFQDSERYKFSALAEYAITNGFVDVEYDEQFALRYAAKHNWSGVVNLLLQDSRVDPTARNNEAIKEAARYGHYDVVKALLVDGRANPIASENFALRIAIEHGHADVVELLLEDGRCNPAANDMIALRVAVKARECEIAMRILHDRRLPLTEETRKKIGNNIIRMKMHMEKDGREPQCGFSF